MAETPSRVGTITLAVDGDWDIEDLLALSESLTETYGLFYPLVSTDEEATARLHELVRRTFWSGDIDSRHIGRRMYRAIPKPESLRLKSFHYSSPGALELMGVLAVLLMMARVARSFIATGDAFFKLWANIEKFFDDRKELKKPKTRTALDERLEISSDEARRLVFEIGPKLGFDDISCERLIDIVGNPISTLKFLVAVGREGRKLAELQNSNLLQLPSPPEDSISIPPVTTKARGRRRGTEFVIKRSRKRKPDS